MVPAPALLLLVLAPILCNGFFLDTFIDHTHWDSLKVTWGLNILDSNNFNALPRTEAEARKDHWVELVPGASCDGNPKFVGKRYWKNNDLSAIVIFGSQGHIAGLQIGEKKNASPNPNHFPYTKQQGAPFVLEGDTFFLTAYFVDPSTVCTGRSAAQFQTQGTGTGIWIQNGTNPTANSIKAPMTETAADRTRWTQGSCFATMGRHYWYNLSPTMDCEDFFPVFLLYNKGVLNAFGWALSINLSGSHRLEHPPQSSYGMFMKQVPNCFPGLGTITTMHVYLTHNAALNDC